MKHVMTLARKELRSYFNAPIAWLVAIIFLVFTSVWFFFFRNFVAENVASMREYFGIMPLVFVVLLPALTMRSWAEEYKVGTAELLLTLPYRELELVIGKFLGTFFLLLMMLACTLPVPLLVMPLGRFELGPIVGEYLGIILLGAAGISIGQFISVRSTNQISAFILTVLAMLVLTLIEQANAVLNPPQLLADIIAFFSLSGHFESFRRGLIDSRDILFFAGTSALFLYLSERSLLFRKWR